MGERFWTADKVVGLLRVHIVTVRVWLRTGQLRGVALSRKSGYRVAEADLAAFIWARTGRSLVESEHAAARTA